MAAAFLPGAVLGGRSARMRVVAEFLRVISDSDSPVLITGESGTGKCAAAGAIHQDSRRREQPFVAVSCALFSDLALELELFGREAAASVPERAGRFEQAHRGTLFLDDVDDVPPAAQIRLLRALESRAVERIGGSRAVPVDVRVIAGSKRDLKQMVGEGAFREDLYYRLSVLPVVLPPLRERREDIPALMEQFLARHCAGRAGPPPVVSDAVKLTFARYSWPGNVRELENACERIAQTCTCGTVRVGCIPSAILFGASGGDESAAAASPPAQAVPISLDDRLRDVEASLIRWALGASGGNKSRAAALLNIKRSTLGDRITRCGLDCGPAARPGSGERS
jgi:two-component system response regulator HydG